MRHAIAIKLSPDENTLLVQVIRSGKSPQRQVERSRVVLLGAAGRTNEQIGAELVESGNDKKGSWLRARIYEAIKELNGADAKSPTVDQVLTRLPEVT